MNKNTDAEIEAMENDQFDLGETLCVFEGFETDVKLQSDFCAVGWSKHLSANLCA